MFFWIRKKPADFTEFLAELERGEKAESCGPAGAAPEDDDPSGDDGARDPGSTGAGAHDGGRLRLVLSCLMWPWTRGGKSAQDHAAAAYAEAAAEDRSTEAPAPPEPRSAAPRPPKTENEVIAEELGLARRLARADLLELRRAFARRNHPDRCPPAQRPRAARRMAIANMLIDAELKRLQRP